jgi:glucose/arabinose dehydrogenase
MEPAALFIRWDIILPAHTYNIKEETTFAMKSFKLLHRILILGTFLTISACAEAEEPPSIVTSQQAEFHVETIAHDLNHPWAMQFLPDDGYLISERRGKLWRITPDGQKIEITNIPAVYHEGQGGLLDIALEPEFKDGGWLYFSYAAASTENEDHANTEVARGKLNLRQNRLSDIEIIFKASPKVEGGNHWGSRLLFAPDGLLYITLGERFDYKEEAQNPQNHLGAVVRITPSGEIPADNPFTENSKSLSDIYSYGHRNAQGIALHPSSNKVWLHEHGPKGGDEINILKSGANYGWPEVTFGISYWGLEISDKTTAPGMEDPILQWTPSIAPSGMAFYTGDKFPAWNGDLFVGALAGKHLRRLELDGEVVMEQEELLKDRNERIRDVRMGPDGYLYVLTDESNGKLLRLEPL